MGDFGNFLNGFAKSPQLIVLNIDCVQFILKNCEIPHSVHRGLYDKLYCFTSDVMYKRYKRLVYTPPDLLARICKVNLSKAKKFGLICSPRICFRGLTYSSDQEPLWLLNVIEDVCYFFWCTYKAINSMWDVSLSYNLAFPSKSLECALELTDLWITSLLI